MIVRRNRKRGGLPWRWTLPRADERRWRRPRNGRLRCGRNCRALFVEDVDLLRLASLPIANEVPLSYAVPRPLGVAGLECVFRAHAEQVRRALAEAAERLQIRWSFQVQRGDLVRTSRAMAEQAELLIVGMAETAGTAPCERRASAGSILVIDEGSSSSDGVLQVAAELAQANLGDLVVLSPAAENGAGASRRRQIDRCLDGLSRRLHGSALANAGRTHHRAAGRAAAQALAPARAAQRTAGRSRSGDPRQAARMPVGAGAVRPSAGED